MCEVGLIVTAALSAYQLQQQGSKAGKMHKYQEEYQRATEQRAAKAAQGKYTAMLERYQQTMKSGAVEMNRALRESEQAMGTAAAAGASAGLGRELTQDIKIAMAMEGSEFFAIRARNQEWTGNAILAQFEEIRAGQEAHYLTGVGKHIAGPDYAGILGNLGSQAVDAFGRYTLRQEIAKGRLVNNPYVT